MVDDGVSQLSHVRPRHATTAVRRRSRPQAATRTCRCATIPSCKVSRKSYYGRPCPSRSILKHDGTGQQRRAATVAGIPWRAPGDTATATGAFVAQRVGLAASMPAANCLRPRWIPLIPAGRTTRSSRHVPFFRDVLTSSTPRFAQRRPISSDQDGASLLCCTAAKMLGSCSDNVCCACRALTRPAARRDDTYDNDDGC